MLRKQGLKDEIWAPAGFVFDFESIPNLIRGPIGENKRGGAVHDILSRKNVCEGITQGIAADVYFEIMEYCDKIDTQRFAKAKHPFIPGAVVVPYVKVKDWARRWLKSEVVRYWPGGFWQKYELTATALEIAGIANDPYITVEKIDAAIVQSIQATDAVKSVPSQVDGKAVLVNASEQVTEGLRDAKKKVEDVL
ncbi:MAG TPA: DUF1353 domain-containing protein [Candidatus Wunengus sp. YC61]|uniref:DUF1353 domain-containing protein n=1 Tax=Candidatus Wunengus sp. YC61 TaxID=3367698 RepID=UPI004024B0DD